ISVPRQLAKPFHGDGLDRRGARSLCPGIYGGIFSRRSSLLERMAPTRGARSQRPRAPTDGLFDRRRPRTRRHWPDLCPRRLDPPAFLVGLLRFSLFPHLSLENAEWLVLRSECSHPAHTRRRPDSLRAFSSGPRLLNGELPVIASLALFTHQPRS